MWDSYAILALLYVLGVILLVAEVFIPSGGLLTLAAVAVLIAAVVTTFRHGTTAGVVAIVSCAVMLPAALIGLLKNIHRLPVGKHAAPPNPTARAKGDAASVDELTALVGRCGRSLTPLRPVGTCEFDGRRIYCIAEMGMIDKDMPVQGCGLVNGKDLVVRIYQEEGTPSV